MYDVIKYIWTLDEFKAKFCSVAAEAEKNIESENPPIFLRKIYWRFKRVELFRIVLDDSHDNKVQYKKFSNYVIITRKLQCQI